MASGRTRATAAAAARHGDDERAQGTTVRAMREMERLNVNVSSKTAYDVRRLADKRRTTVTETIRRAVAVLALVEDQETDGWELQFVNPKTGAIRLVTLV